jgi:LSD1 subclass zinc finger protein
VPEGTTAMVRCPACKSVFSPADSAEPEPEPVDEEEAKESQLLICPSCRSGLEVPEGTTAMVRCPACKTVFSPADSAAPEPEEEDRPRKKTRAYRPVEEDEEDDEEDVGKEKHRDFDPDPEDDDRPLRKRPHVPSDELSPEERAERRRAFDRAAWGARLIMISLALFMISMFIISGYFFQSAFGVPQGWIVIVAGYMGLANWLCAAVGLGLCLSGPRAPGHWGYGIAAAAAMAVHFILLGAVVSQAKEYGIVRDEEGGSRNSIRWSMVPTRLNATMFYLTAVAYPDAQGFAPRGKIILSMLTGVAEMVRTVLLMMLLSCLARAALDEELAGRCTRTAGVASGGPGLLAIIIFMFVAFCIETNAGLNMFTLILFTTVHMGVYSIMAGVLLPAYLATQDVVDACEEPFQSLIPNL